MRTDEAKKAHLDSRSTNETYDIAMSRNRGFDMNFGRRVLRVEVVRLAVSAKELLRSEIDDMFETADGICECSNVHEQTYTYFTLRSSGSYSS